MRWAVTGARAGARLVRWGCPAESVALAHEASLRRPHVQDHATESGGICQLPCGGSYDDGATYMFVDGRAFTQCEPARDKTGEERVETLIPSAVHLLQQDDEGLVNDHVFCEAGRVRPCLFKHRTQADGPAVQIVL